MEQGSLDIIGTGSLPWSFDADQLVSAVDAGEERPAHWKIMAICDKLQLITGYVNTHQIVIKERNIIQLYYHDCIFQSLHSGNESVVAKDSSYRGTYFKNQL